MTFNPFAMSCLGGERGDWPLEPCVGDTHTDPDGRLWTYKAIAGGKKGGRWAYRIISIREEGRVIVDALQNMEAHHFAGMLAIPWDGHAQMGWVLSKPYCHRVPPPTPTPEPVEEVRFERLEEPPSPNDPEA